MQDGFVKEPAVATQKNLDPNRFSKEETEKIKLEDGIRLHEDVKVRLETYARETEQNIVKPFVLIIARDITHAGELLKLIQSDGFFEGRYKDKVIQVDSSKTGAEEEEMIGRLLKVEHADEPTEIVIHPRLPAANPRDVIEFDWAWDLEASPRQLWPHVSNTERVNRALGLPAPNFTSAVLNVASRS